MDEFSNNKKGNNNESEIINNLIEKVDKNLSLTFNSVLKNTSNSSPRKMCVNDFKLIKNLGKGSYARVISATHINSNKNYALKIINKSFIEKEEKVNEVHVERILLSTFNHPNIIKLFYTFQNSKKLYFVLEMAEKGDLKHYIKSHNTIPYDLAKFFTAEIVNGLEYMHKKGYMHRDLKPENILVTNRLHLKICDFSTASLIGNYFDSKERKFVIGEEKEMTTHQKSDLIGTAEYISPEMIDKGKSYFSSDLWALGIILFQFLHGFTPFVGSNQDNTVLNIINKNMTQISENVNQDARDLISKLIIYDPKKRIGADVTDQSENGYKTLKNHKFFQGIDFDNLEKIESYINSNCSQQTSSSSSNVTSPANNSFSSAFGDSLEVTNFNLNDDDKESDVKLSILNKNNLIPVKKNSGLMSRDKKSLFFKKVTESNDLVDKKDFEIKYQLIDVMYEDIIQKKCSDLFYHDYRILLYRNKVEYIGLDRISERGEIILDKLTKIILKDDNEFLLNVSNCIYEFKSEKKNATEWVERISDIIDLL